MVAERRGRIDERHEDQDFCFYIYPNPCAVRTCGAARIACRERIARLDTTIPELAVYRAQAKMRWSKDRQALNYRLMRQILGEESSSLTVLC